MRLWNALARCRPSTTAIASCILFVAFLAQNVYSTQWASERARLERSQLVIDLEQTRRDYWLVLYESETSKAEANQRVLGLALENLLEANGNLLVWSSGRTMSSGTDYQQALDARNRTRTEAQQLRQSGDIQGLSALAARTSIATAIQMPLTDQRFFAAVDKVEERQKRWTQVFIWSYVCASLLFAGAYLRERWRESESSRGAAQPVIPPDARKAVRRGTPNH